MTREQIEIALEALEFYARSHERQLAREPRTRGGKPNQMRLHLLQGINSIAEARHALSEHLQAIEHV
jgi:hypothetical protein